MFYKMPLPLLVGAFLLVDILHSGTPLIVLSFYECYQANNYHRNLSISIDKFMRPVK